MLRKTALLHISLFLRDCLVPRQPSLYTELQNLNVEESCINYCKENYEVICNKQYIE